MILTKDKTEHELIGQYGEFLTDYYRDDIGTALQEGQDSITVEYADLFQFNPDLAEDTVEKPERCFPEFDRALTEVDMPVPGSVEKLADMVVRLSGVDVEDLTVNTLRSNHRKRYLGLRGQVSRASQVHPRVVKAVFRCENCSTTDHDHLLDPIPQYGDEVQLPGQCPGCEKKGPFTLVEDKSVFVDHQKVELADEPGENMGANSHTVPVHFYRDEAGRVMPGDRIRVNGLISTDNARANQSTSKISTSRPWRIEGRSIDPEEVAFAEVEPERVDEIQEAAASDTLVDDVIESVAPKIISDERGRMHKLAIALQWFGGVAREGRRSDIHVFFVGSKGTGKSKLLNRGAEIAPKSVEASGKGATAAGLTATATQSEHGGWMLDAGALVLASGGMASVDEFDKMGSAVRKSMHEAMEDQRVPINKAGINTVLPTETAILAAANPNGGQFDRFDNLTTQIDLEAPLISRFDLIFGLVDTEDEAMDEEIARSQYESTPTTQPIDDELLTEYVAYARQNIHPEFASTEVEDHLIDWYVSKRKEYASEEGLNIGPRTNDALRRLSEASARMRLSDTVEMEDAKRAIELKKMHFGDVMFDRDGEFDAAQGSGYTNDPQTQEEKVDAIREMIEEHETTDVGADIEAVMTAAQNEYDMSPRTVEGLIQNLREDGRAYEPQQGKVRLT
jgi:replicative DNA helicase Mcm